MACRIRWSFILFRGRDAPPFPPASEGDLASPPDGREVRRSNSASAPCDYGNYMLAGFASTIGWPGALVPKEGITRNHRHDEPLFFLSMMA
jgi:hypothetical protein